MQMFLIAINGDFMTQVRNIFAAFTCNKKRPRTTDLLAGKNEFHPYDLECKYANCSGIVKPYQAGRGGLRCPDGQTHSCLSETSYPVVPKLGNFSLYP